MERPELSISPEVNAVEDWKTDMSCKFREGMTDKIEQAMTDYGSSLPSTAKEMESRVFSRAGSKAEYLDFMGRMIIHLNIVGSNHDTPIIPQPTVVEEIQEGGMGLVPATQIKPLLRLAKGMDDYPKSLFNPRVAPYDVPTVSDPGNEFQPMEPMGMIKRSNMLMPATGMARGLDFGFPMENQLGKSLTGGSGDSSDDDVKQYICKLILEDRARQLKRAQDQSLGAEELHEKKKSIEEFAALCMAKVNHKQAQQEPSLSPSSDQCKNEETGREIPAYLCDKWSHKIFKDPVITPSGHTYERSGIENHLRTKGNYDPVTRLTLTADLLVPNISMKQVVCAYMAENTHIATRTGPNDRGRKTIISEQSFIAAKRVRLCDE